MAEFDDFHFVVQPSIQHPGTWSVLLDACPILELTGPKGDIQPQFTRLQLVSLRSQHDWPDLNKLKAIGQSVAQSLLTPDLRAALVAAQAVTQAANRGIRLVISMVGEEAALLDNNTIRLQELPVEALLVDGQNFLAQNPRSPLSRSLRFKADRAPVRVTLPLRVLVVVSTPRDKPPANAQREKDAIDLAFQQLAGPGGAFTLEFCEPPTKSELITRLQKGFDILHFVGHGAFDVVGDDPSPRPHLCLVKDGDSDPIDADTLDTLLLNSGIRLAVMTACASAAPTPEEVQETVGPFCGVAQRLVSGLSGVNASVAMQFDLEADAAVTFSRTFYTQLLSSGSKLDEIVTQCRRALAGEKGVGHRAWVTPVIYWRCQDGRVFDIEPMRGAFDEKTRSELLVIERQIEFHLRNIASIRSQPANVLAAVAPLIATWQQEVEDLMRDRGQKLGETLRLRGGQAAAGSTVACQLLLRLRTPAQVGDVNLRVRYAADRVGFSAATAGGAIPGALPLVGMPAPGELIVQLNNVSQGVQWAPGEFELVTLRFQVNAGVTDPVLHLSLADANVRKDGIGVVFNTLDGVVFVT